MKQRTRRCAWVATLAGLLIGTAAGQAPKATTLGTPATANVEQPDAQRMKEGLIQLLERYPPALRASLGLDSSLLSNQAYLAPYPALASYLNAHPEILRNPSFYVGEMSPLRRPESNKIHDLIENIMAGLGVFSAFCVVIGMVVWSVRTIVDYRRWNRLAKVQTDAHTKLLDRFTANEDLLRYMQTPAGAKFLESSPIRLDAGPRSMGAPLNRILWSVQAGVVLSALGVGFNILSGRTGAEGADVLAAFGVIAISLGVGLMLSALVAYLISRKAGLLDRAATEERQ